MAQIEALLLRPFANQHLESFKNFDSIPNFLIVMRTDGSYVLYPGKLNLSLKVTVQKPVEPGDAVYVQDIGDILKIYFSDIELHESDNIIFFFSHLWRHGLYFNFSSTTKKRSLCKENLATRLAQHYLELLFSRCYRNDNINLAIQEDGWFPFLAILGKPFDLLYNAYKNEPELPEKDQFILDHFNRDRLVARIQSWKQKPIFSKEQAFIESALSAYFREDHIACISILYPRIEGILRQLYLPTVTKPNVPLLLEKLKSVVNSKVEDFSLFRQHQFVEYLQNWFFRGFDLASRQVDLSRHSTAHGVATAEHFTKARSLIGFLILDQIYFYV